VDERSCVYCHILYFTALVEEMGQIADEQLQLIEKQALKEEGAKVCLALYICVC
jgi:hypothetical protein